MDFSNEKIIGRVIEIPNDDILPNRFQPRKYFDEADTLELAESIKEHGILQPIVVRSVGDKYEIIAGERRFKANILAGNDSIPAIVSNLDDKESSEIAVIENIQRQNLTPIEEAISYKRIIDMGYVTQEDLAKKVGKSQSAIANKIRLLRLSDNVQEALMEKRISERHARSLLKLESLKKQDELLDRIINERLTVRKTDEEINKMNNNMNNQTISNFNQPQTNTFNPFDQTIAQPVFNQSVQQTVEPVQTQQSEPQTVSPIMGTPLSTFDQPQATPIFNEPVQNTVANEHIETPTMDQPLFSQPTDQPAINNMPVFDQTIAQPNIFDQPQATPTFPEPVQNTVANEPVETPTIDQSVQDFNQPNFDQQIEQNIQTDIPLSSLPVSNYTTTSFLDTTPIELNNNSDNGDNGDSIVENQFNFNQSNFDQSLTQPNILDQTIAQPTINTPAEIETPTFTPEQPIETNVGIATPVVDLNQSIDPVPNNDIPLTSSISATETPDPIIVTNDDSQFDPIMPEQPSNEPTLDFKTIINLIRQCSETIEKCGYKIDTEEYDLEGKYQVTFTIEK